MSSIQPTPTIRALRGDDAAAYHALRLRALRDHPTAFGASVEDWDRRTIEQVAERLNSQDGAEAVTLGGLVDGELVGSITLLRGDGKEHHRAHIVGMYVAPEQRREGVGRALLAEAVARARAMAGLELVLLAVASGNDPARRLYAQAGFTTHNVDWHAMKIDGAYVDLEWMRLEL